MTWFRLTMRQAMQWARLRDVAPPGASYSPPQDLERSACGTMVVFVDGSAIFCSDEKFWATLGPPPG